MLDVTTLSPSAEEMNNNNEYEEAELPPLQDIINYNILNVTNILHMYVVFRSFLASQGPCEASGAR